MTDQHSEAAPRNWGGERQMGELEATMWRAGRHPENSTQGAMMEILDGTVEWTDLLALHHAGLQRYPRFTQRVQEPALPIGPPVWVDDETFDLADHLSRVKLPEPGSTRQLLDTAQSLATTPLDPAKPPWSATMIEGLQDGRSAYLLVVHHCLMDGHGSVQLLSDLHTPAGPGDATHQTRGRTTAPSVGPLQLTAEQLMDGLRGLPKFAGQVMSGAARVIRSGPLDAVRFAASAGRVLTPPADKASALLQGGSRKKWHYEVLNCSLADLKAAGKAVGGTVNDAYVAGIIGGLRIYHEKHGAPIGDITINMPVSLRRPDDPHGGNRFVTAFLQAPSSVVDPRERVTRLRQIVSRLSDEPALDLFGALLPIFNRAPAAVLAPLFSSLQDRTDLTISNVPGMKTAVKFGGCTVESVYYFAPLPGCHIATVLFSYNGRCDIGITCDEDVFGDSDELISCLRAGVNEALALQG